MVLPKLIAIAVTPGRRSIAPSGLAVIAADISAGLQMRLNCFQPCALSWLWLVHTVVAGGSGKTSHSGSGVAPAFPDVLSHVDSPL